jgi:hypothetical protein
METRRTPYFESSPSSSPLICPSLLDSFDPGFYLHMRTYETCDGWSFLFPTIPSLQFRMKESARPLSPAYFGSAG